MVYPISSKLPMFKKFRKSLTEFFERLIFSSAESDQLYNTELMRCIQYWVTPMSSSQIRGFRHTSTIIALEIETALVDVAASVEKEAEVVARQRKGERKRKGGTGGGSKELEAKANVIREKRTKVAEYLKDFVDGYVHGVLIRLSLTCSDQGLHAEVSRYRLGNSHGMCPRLGELVPEVPQSLPGFHLPSLYWLGVLGRKHARQA